MNDLTHLSLFSGIGGLDLAAEWAGFRTVGQCEWADYPRAVLEKHWQGMPRWKDIRTLTGDDFYEHTGLRTVKRSMYAGLMKATILDTLGHVVEDIKAMKNINPEQVRVECNIYDQEHIYRDCTVQILENTRTGEISVGWWQNDKEHDR